MNHAQLSVRNAQVPARRDVSDSDERVPVHEAAVPLGAHVLQAPQGPRVNRGRARLEEYTVGLFAHARLRQREALVHVAVKEAEHVATVHEAVRFAARVARRQRQQSPQGLLKGRVDSMYQTIDRVNVLKK